MIHGPAGSPHLGASARPMSGDLRVRLDLTGMEYGGITPLGLPAQWPILVDTVVAAGPYVVIGSGVRRSKLLLPGKTVAELPGAEVIALTQ